MRTNRVAGTLLAALLLAVQAACSPGPAGEGTAAATGSEAAAAAPMDLDSLYSLPSLIGTSPALARWSADSTTLAFAWSDRGLPFRDIWLWSADTGELERLTRHGDGFGETSLHQGVSDLSWLGEGSDRLAYVLDGSLYLADADGPTEKVQQEVTGVRHLDVAPGGKALAFVGRTSGGGSALWVAPLQGGTLASAAVLVDALDGKTAVRSYEWSADGARIAFLRSDQRDMPERDLHFYANGRLQVNRVTRAFPGDETARYSLGVAELDTGSIQWLELPDDQHPIWDYGLSADGSRLFANTSDHLVKEHTIYVFDVKTGRREVHYRYDDPQNVIPGWQAAWAPGGDGLVILTDRDGYYHLYHQREAGGAVRALTAGQWEIASFEVDDAAGMLYFVANRSHPSERQVYRVPFEGGEVEALTVMPGTWAPEFSTDYSRVALHFSNDMTPPELYAGDLSLTEGPIRITHSPLPDFTNYDWARVRYLEFESHVDGATLHARLMVPRDFDPSQRYPLIVGSVYADALRNQWGGRTAHPTWGLDQYFVSDGYLVLTVNIRGSWGHGKAFSQGLLHDYGGIDTDDIESGVRYLVAEGYVDPERVGIWGSSYGGLMTLMSLFKKPGVYAAGIAGAPATNVAHAFPSQQWVMGEPAGEDYPERYQRQSALYHHEGLSDPLMIIHGTNDSVVLYSDTIALTERLVADGKQFELLTLPGASHSWDTDSLEQTRFAFKKMAEFFDRYLK